jgi:hypothetical protein
MRKLLLLAAALALIPDLAWAQSAAMRPVPPRIIGGTATSDTAAGVDYGAWLVWKSTAAGTKTQTLPGCGAAVNGLGIGVADGQGNAATNNISIAPAGSNTINGAATPIPINTNRGTAQFVCDGTGTNWILVTSGGGGGTTSSVTMGGDVTGNSATATVVKLQGVPVSSTAPSANQVLSFVSPNWVPSSPAVTVTTSCPSTSQTASTINLLTGTVSNTVAANYTIVAADCRKVLGVAAGPVKLPVVAGLVANFGVSIVNTNGTGGASIAVQTTDSSNIAAGGTIGTSITLVPGASMYALLNPANTGWIGIVSGNSSGGGGGSAITGPGYQVGGVVQFRGPHDLTGSATGTTSFTYCAPGWLDNVSATSAGSGTVSAINFRVVNAGTTGTAPLGTAQVAIMSDQFQSGVHRPGSVIGSTAPFVTTTTGVLTPSFQSPISLSGLAVYWTCVQVGDTAVTYEATASGAWWGALVGGSGTFNMLKNTQFTNALRASTTFGTWPTSGASWTELGSNNGPFIVFSFSSIP